MSIKVKLQDNIKGMDFQMKETYVYLNTQVLRVLDKISLTNELVFYRISRNFIKKCSFSPKKLKT